MINVIAEDFEQRLKRERTEVEAVRQEMVPICGSYPLTIPRHLWNQAWLAFTKKHRRELGEYTRILREGFYASELDDLLPGWRETDRLIKDLRQKLIEQAAREVFFEEAPRIAPVRHTYATLDAVPGGLSISYRDLCRLSKVFGFAADLSINTQDYRINEWLKALLAATRP